LWLFGRRLAANNGTFPECINCGRVIKVIGRFGVMHNRRIRVGFVLDAIPVSFGGK
jgi:hypothetical protein